MLSHFILFLCLLTPALTSAQVESRFNFTGQNADVLKVEKEIKIYTPETVEIPSTCTRQVPAGQREVCYDETRYRQECSWIPSYQNCWNDTDRVCRTLPMTRQECVAGPNRRVCTERPSRRVCTDREIREVCRTTANGRRHCQSVPHGESRCTEVGGGTVCNEVPGQRICRMVNYYDSVCDNVIRRRCETVPGRNECRSIPYSIPVCQMETINRTESYACTRTEVVNRVTKKTLKIETDIQLITNGLVDEFSLNIIARETNPQYSAFTLEASLVEEPNVFVVLRKKTIKVIKNAEAEIQAQGNIVLEILTREMLQLSFPTAVREAVLSDKNKNLLVTFDGNISSLGTVEVKLTHNPFLSGTKTIADLREEYPSPQVELVMDRARPALRIDLSSEVEREFKKNMKLKVVLETKLDLKGELLNSVRPQTFKKFEEISVQLK
jgi:hypothetical protein